MDRTRTYRSLQNSIIGVTVYVISLLLSFISRKIYLDYLGTELLGLNTTAQNLLGFLNIAELGIGSAIACTLYKPLYDNDKQAINEIVSLQGWLYRKIALIVGIGALILMIFFPLIFHKTEVPLGYTYLSFGVFLTSSLLSYFINYRVIVLSANQKDFKYRGSYNAVLIIKTIIQIIAVRYCSNPYIWWCVIEFIFAFLACGVAQIVVKIDSPYLKTDIQSGKLLKDKYPEVITKVKQLFFHKISGFVLSQSWTIIIYAFTSLTTVALVGNYNAIISSIRSFVGAAIGNIGASVGNLVSENNKEKTLSVFEELFSVRFFIASVVCFCIIRLSSPFVSLWIGSDYVLSQSTVVLLTAGIFISITRITVDDYINAKGLFKDIWAPITEAIINIFTSVLMGHYFGVNGILCGGIISQVLIVLIWKPYFLFSSGLKEPIKIYVLMYFKHIVALVICYFLGSVIIDNITLAPSESFHNWILCGIVYALIFGVILLILQYSLSKGMRSFVFRMRKIIIRK